MLPTFRAASFDFLEDPVPDHIDELPSSRENDPACYALVGEVARGGTSYTLAVNVGNAAIAGALREAHLRHLRRVFGAETIDGQGSNGWKVHIIPPLEPEA